jgi:hypothetical protein
MSPSYRGSFTMNKRESYDSAYEDWLVNFLAMTKEEEVVYRKAVQEVCDSNMDYESEGADSYHPNKAS